VYASDWVWGLSDSRLWRNVRSEQNREVGKRSEPTRGVRKECLWKAQNRNVNMGGYRDSGRAHSRCMGSQEDRKSLATRTAGPADGQPSVIIDS